MASKLSQSDILEAIDGMTVLELSEFIKAFEERYGVTAAAPAAVAVAAAPAAAEAEVVEEQSEFSAILADVGPNKIPVIKVVRELTGLGLKRPQGRQGGRRQGGGREDQGRPRGAGRQGRDQVALEPIATRGGRSASPRAMSRGVARRGGVGRGRLAGRPVTDERGPGATSRV